MKFRKSEQGFALIELLVVLSIIGVLSGMVLVSVSEAKEKARDSKRVQQIAQIDTAIQLYKSDHDGKAPTFYGACSRGAELGTANGYCVAVSGEITGGGYSPEWTAFRNEIGQYMHDQVPNDPCGTSCGDGLGYVYIAPAAVPNATGDDDYQIYANLERTSNQTGFSSTNDPFVPPHTNEENDGPDTVAPSVPLNVGVVLTGPVGNQNALVTWDASSDTGGSGVAGYRVQMIDNGGDYGGPVESSGTSFSFPTNLGFWQHNLCFTVMAYDGVGNTSDFTVLTAQSCVDVPQPTPEQIVSAPTNLHAVYTDLPGPKYQMQFSWDTSTSFQNPGTILGYELYKNGNIVITWPTNNYPYNYQGSSNGLWNPITPYCWSVKAYDWAGNKSAMSACIPSPSP